MSRGLRCPEGVTVRATVAAWHEARACRFCSAVHAAWALVGPVLALLYGTDRALLWAAMLRAAAQLGASVRVRAREAASLDGIARVVVRLLAGAQTGDAARVLACAFLAAAIERGVTVPPHVIKAAWIAAFPRRRPPSSWTVAELGPALDALTASVGVRHAA